MHNWSCHFFEHLGGLFEISDTRVSVGCDSSKKEIKGLLLCRLTLKKLMEVKTEFKHLTYLSWSPRVLDFLESVALKIN